MNRQLGHIKVNNLDNFVVMCTAYQKETAGEPSANRK